MGLAREERNKDQYIKYGVPTMGKSFSNQGKLSTATGRSIMMAKWSDKCDGEKFPLAKYLFTKRRDP